MTQKMSERNEKLADIMSDAKVFVISRPVVGKSGKVTKYPPLQVVSWAF